MGQAVSLRRNGGFSCHRGSHDTCNLAYALLDAASQCSRALRGYERPADSEPSYKPNILPHPISNASLLPTSHELRPRGVSPQRAREHKANESTSEHQGTLINSHDTRVYNWPPATGGREPTTDCPAIALILFAFSPPRPINTATDSQTTML